jgi:hypothetical protein
MKSYLMTLFVCVPLLQAADIDTRAQYIGGTVAGVHSKSDVRIDVQQPDVLQLRAGSTSLEVPYKDVTTLEYGMRVSRRYMSAVLISPLFLVAKTRKHFLTIGFTDKNGIEQAIVLQVGKDEIRPLLVSLEARTGRRIEFQDDEARKAGKG